MATYTRGQIINMGLDRNAKASEIDAMLKRHGYNVSYNPLLEKETWQRLPSNVVSGAKNIARDFRTLGGYIVKPVADIEYAYRNAPEGKKLSEVKKAFTRAINDDRYRKTLAGAIAGGGIGAVIPKVGPIAGALTGASLGVSGGPKELADAILQTYNTSTDDIKGNYIDWRDLAQGVMQHPVYAALDTAPLYGKGLTSKVVKSLDKAPKSVKQFLPDENMRALNRQITNSMLSARTKGMKNYQGYLTLETMPKVNREKLVKNVITNDTTGMTQDEIALSTIIKNNLRNSENEFISRGYGDAKEFRDNARAQYVMYKLDNDPQLLHDDVYRIIRGEDLRTGNPMPSKNKLNKIKTLADEGGKLYDENKISWLSQKLSPIQDETGNVIARDFNKEASSYFDTNRIIGKQSTEKLASVFDRTLKEQVDQLSKFINVEDILNDLVTNFERQKILTVGADKKVPIGKTAFSVNAFKNYIKKYGPDVELNEALNSSKVAEEGALILDDMYLYMINNAFKRPSSSGGRRLLNAFKKTVLANPHWIVLNRLGNWTNNFMNGVMLEDYTDAIKASKNNLIPEELQHQTSFGSYINTLEGADNIKGVGSTRQEVGHSVKQPVSRLKQSIDKFKQSPKRVEDIAEVTAQVLANTSDVTANPFYKIEAALEYTDRSANLVRQAKEYGLTHNMDWKDVLSKAKEDSGLFSELNTNVNKALGDYIGKNYAMPKGYYDVLSGGVPFYRFLTQTARTTASQLKHNPLGFAMTTTIPSRAGYNLSKEYVERYGLDPEEYTGGVPYLEENGNIRTIGGEPLPAAGVLEMFANLKKGTELRNMLSPHLTTFPDIISFQKYGKSASSPRKTRMMLEGRYTDTQGKYEPTLGETLAYALNTIASTSYHPYRLITNQGRELASAISGRGIQSLYDTTPLGENHLSYKRTLPVELTGKWIGIQTRSNYKKKNSPYKRNLNKSMSRKLSKQIKYNQEK